MTNSFITKCKNSLVHVNRRHSHGLNMLGILLFGVFLTPAVCTIPCICEQRDHREVCLPAPVRLNTSHVELSSDKSTDENKSVHSATESERQSIWIGPMPFIEGRTLREGFFTAILDSLNGSTIWEAMIVFKSYLMILPTAPIPGNSAPEASDSQLTALIEKLEQNSVKTAFEVGGARSRAPGSGKYKAQNEFAHLARWLNLGGQIHYLSTDHSLMRGLDAWLDVTDPAVSAEMSYVDTEVRELFDDLYRELVAYFLEMKTLIPGVRFGVIESLGYFYVEGADNVVYSPTRPEIPKLPFCEIIRDLKMAMEAAGLVLDHFHTDYGYEGVHFDGRLNATLDYGRIIGVEQCVRNLGIKTGNIINAFHDRSVSNPEREIANQEALSNTLLFFEGYMSTGLYPDHYVLQTWQPFPDKTGPETEPGTVLHLFREVLLHPLFTIRR